MYTCVCLFPLLHSLYLTHLLHFPCSMINADFCTGSVLISFGAVLGKTSPVQLLTMAIFEVTMFAINEYILLSLFEVSQFRASNPLLA